MIAVLASVPVRPMGRSAAPPCAPSSAEGGGEPAGWPPIRGETTVFPVARRAAQQPGPAQRGHALRLFFEGGILIVHGQELWQAMQRYATLFW